jgi:hypothetical protein
MMPRKDTSLGENKITEGGKKCLFLELVMTEANI